MKVTNASKSESDGSESGGSDTTTASRWMLSIDMLHVLFLVVFVILYPIGAMYDNPKFKIPIYVALTV